MIAVAAEAAVQGDGCATDEPAWPVVEVVVRVPEDLERAIDALEEIVAAERPFAMLVSGPPSLAAWQRLLWGSPGARSRLRRLRPSLGTWCAGSAHLVDADDDVGASPAALRPAELAWGCAARAFASPPEAHRWLRAGLAGR